MFVSRNLLLVAAICGLGAVPTNAQEPTPPAESARLVAAAHLDTPVPATVAILSTPTAAQAPAQDPKAEKPTIDVGPLRNIKFTGLVQVWFSAGDQQYVDTFRLRRTELYLTADITPKARFQVMIDPSKALSVNSAYDTIGGKQALTGVTVNQASRILQNAYISLFYIPHIQLDVGQYKLPMTLEGLYNSGQLETVERALFLSDRTRGGAYGDVRELGVTARGKISPQVDFSVGVFNGLSQNQNDLDKDNRKSVVGRVVTKPAKGLQIGGTGAVDADKTPATPRNRLGLDLLWTRGPFMLKSEYSQGKDGALNRQGYYVHLGYKILPKLEAVFRYDTWDPDKNHETNAADVLERDYIAGVNIFLSGHNVKFQADYVRKTFNNSIAPTRNLLLTNMQVLW
jgi:hypothetical protein